MPSKYPSYGNSLPADQAGSAAPQQPYPDGSGLMPYTPPGQQPPKEGGWRDWIPRLPVSKEATIPDSVVPPTTATELPGKYSLPVFTELASCVHNLHCVTPNLFRGGQPDLQALALLKKLGVKTIINLRTEDELIAQEGKQAKGLGMRYVSIPLEVFVEPTEDQVKKFLKAVKDPVNQPVYVHCMQGQDRTGTMVAVYKVDQMNWDATRAYKDAIYYGFRPGFASLGQVIFDHARALGRPATPPSAEFIITDVQQRMERMLKKYRP
jgi:protein tyrosine phosphatase (PTP) superfamily phosphohydrolase (DUF442 family)